MINIKDIKLIAIPFILKILGARVLKAYFKSTTKPILDGSNRLREVFKENSITNEIISGTSKVGIQ